MSYQNIQFAGIRRVNDGVMIASVFDRISSQEKNEIEKSCHVLVEDSSYRFSPGSREKRPFANGVIYLLADNELVCVYGVAIQNKNYPERVAFAFLGELISAVAESSKDLLASAEVDSLSRSLRKPMKKLMDKFDDPAKIDAVAQVQGKVDDVKDILEEALSKVIVNHEAMQDLEQQAECLKYDAQSFGKNAHNLERLMWYKKLRASLCLGFLCVAFLAYVICMVLYLLL